MVFKFISKDKIKKLPKKSGVYCFKEGRKILYIGKAVNLRERVKNHFQQPAFRDYLFLDKIKKIGYIKTDSEIEALILEANLIKKYQPKYNILWRDDKNYFFVGMTKEDSPRIFLTHQTKLKTKDPKLKAEYVGPFVDGKSLKQVLKILRKVFPYRSCRKIPNRPCLWYHLNRCPAPCLLRSRFIKEISLAPLKIKRVTLRNVRNLIKILKEGKGPVLKELKKEMRLASKNQNFEEAAKIRDQILALEKITEHAKIFEPETTVKPKPWQAFYRRWEETEKKMKEILKIEKKISRIEAYDVSNIVGQAASGSMVTFINGQANKNFYRRFKIKIAGKPNDMAMLKEILSRRFKHPEWPYPDLILIDGGKAQLNAALEVKKSTPGVDYRVMSLAKKGNKLFIEGQKKPILLQDLPREIFNLFLQLRDEAHRFALTYHKKLRERNLIP